MQARPCGHCVGVVVGRDSCQSALGQQWNIQRQAETGLAPPLETERADRTGARTFFGLSRETLGWSWMEENIPGSDALVRLKAWARRAALPAAFVVALTALVAILAVVSDPSLHRSPSELLSVANERIRFVSRYRGIEVIGADIGGCLDQRVDCAASVIGDVAKSIRAHPAILTRATSVAFVFNARTETASRPTYVRLYTITFRAADLRTRLMTKLSGAQILNMAIDVTSDPGVARQALVTWCTRNDAKSFCGMIRP